MTEGLSLRERKKISTRGRLLRTAMRLFAERGFDQVSVAEIAEAAEVSKMTVFNYFGTKEDLVFSSIEEHVADPARVVRERAVGESAVAALRRQFMAALAARDPSVGINDDPLVLAVRRMITDTPVLVIRVHDFHIRSADLLADALVEDGTKPVFARIAAHQLIGARNAIIYENHRRLLAGESSDAIAGDAAALAQQAFDLVEHGLGGFATRVSSAGGAGPPGV